MRGNTIMYTRPSRSTASRSTASRSGTSRSGIAAAAAVLTLVLAACGGDDDDATIEPTGTATAATTTASATESTATEPSATEPSATELSATTGTATESTTDTGATGGAATGTGDTGGGSDIAAKVMVIGDFTSPGGFTVGESLPLTQGALAAYPNVEIVGCDSAGDPNAASQCQRDAVDGDVDAVISGFGYLAQDQSILDEAGIPILGFGDVTQPNTFGTSSSLGAYAGVAMGAVEAGCQQAGIIYLEGTDFLADMLKAGLEVGGAVEAARAAVPSNAPDLAPAIARLIGADSDCILLSVTPPLVVQAVTAINQSGATPTVVATGAILTDEIRAALGDLANGMVVTEIQLNAADDDPVLDEIRADMEAFDEDATLSSVGIQSWASAKVIAAALDTMTGEVTPASLTDAMNALRDVDLQGAMHDFSAIPLSNPAFARFFNHYGLNYVIQDGTATRTSDDWYDIGPALDAAAG